MAAGIIGCYFTLSPQYLYHNTYFGVNYMELSGSLCKESIALTYDGSWCLMISACSSIEGRCC